VFRSVVDDRWIPLLLILHQLARRLLGLIAVLVRKDLSKDAELLVLRQENAVLRHRSRLPPRTQHRVVDPQASRPRSRTSPQRSHLAAVPGCPGPRHPRHRLLLRGHPAVAPVVRVVRRRACHPPGPHPWCHREPHRCLGCSAGIATASSPASLMPCSPARPLRILRTPGERDRRTLDRHHPPRAAGPDTDPPPPPPQDSAGRIRGALQRSPSAPRTAPRSTPQTTPTARTTP
jgi:hypothetical protein